MATVLKQQLHLTTTIIIHQMIELPAIDPPGKHSLLSNKFSTVFRDLSLMRMHWNASVCVGLVFEMNVNRRAGVG